jgi:hypothetical protein
MRTWDGGNLQLTWCAAASYAQSKASVGLGLPFVVVAVHDIYFCCPGIVLGEISTQQNSCQGEMCAQ